MRLADAPDTSHADEGKTLQLPAALLRGDPRLEALFKPFRECITVSETLFPEPTGRTSRQLIVEVRGDIYEQACEVARSQCSPDAFVVKPTELDDVAAGTEWTERIKGLSVFVYRLFGGITSLHVISAKLDPPDAAAKALRASPFAELADVTLATSSIEHLTCARTAGEVPRWHLQAILRAPAEFTAIAEAATALGFEDRNGKHWRDRLLVQAVGKGRWLAALPGIDFAR